MEVIIILYENILSLIRISIILLSEIATSS